MHWLQEHLTFPFWSPSLGTLLLYIFFRFSFLVMVKRATSSAVDGELTRLRSMLLRRASRCHCRAVSSLPVLRSAPVWDVSWEMRCIMCSRTWRLSLNQVTSYASLWSHYVT